MLVKVDINKLNSGRVQIAVFRPEQSAGPVQTYASPNEAKTVLLAFGLPGVEIDEQLEILSEIGPQELLHFGKREIADDVLHTHGFLL